MGMRVLLTRDEINEIVGQLADQISATYADKPVVVVGILNGGFIFCADLVRKLQIGKIRITFIQAESYNHGSTTSSGSVRILQDINVDIQGCDVLVVEDILDTGLTLYKIIDHLKAKDPASIRIVALLSKPDKRDPSLEIVDYLYVGKEIPNVFVVGYGMDDTDGTNRNLQDIWAKC